MARKTKAEAQETRHQLLDAAEQVFREQGVSRTSLQDVAAAAGLTRGAIYWHFKDKADLFTAMMDRVVLPWEEAHEALLSAAPIDRPLETLAFLATDPLERLQASVHIQQVFRIAMHFTEYIDDFAPVRQHQVDSIDHYLNEMAVLFERAASRQLLVAGIPPRAAAMGLFALVDGLMRHWVLLPEQFDLVSTGRIAVTAYLAGLTAPTAAAPAAPARSPQKSPARPAPST
ncbi:MAG TPA: TetR family transcriptional regulator [Ideonella sp.]|nr:TetR family transcriptional regulator [Ideonella sp.]